jgi:ABC-type ATPase involved in cell division
LIVILLKIFKDSNRCYIGLLVATHDAMIVSVADRILLINDGVLVEQ